MNLTGQGALGLLRLAVFEKGDKYVYPLALQGPGDCQNFENGQPSCIVGHVFEKLGVTYDLALAAGIDGSVGAAGSIARLKSHGWTDWTFSLEATCVLISAQSWQDRGSTWGEALAAAEKSLELGEVVPHPLDNR